MTAGPPVVFIPVWALALTEIIDTHQTIVKETWYPRDDTDNREWNTKILVEQVFK